MSFSDEIKRFNNKTQEASTLIFRGTALNLFAKIIRRTPVGNPDLWKNKPYKGYAGGRLRGNWQASINTPMSGEVSGKDKSGESTTNKAKNQTIKANLGDSIFLVNNLPYAKAIEDGRSTQSPTGMVKVTIAEFQHVVKSRARKHKV